MKKHTKKNTKTKASSQKTAKHPSVITICCLVTLVLIACAGTFFGYQYYINSGSTTNIDESIDFEQNFIDLYSTPFVPEGTYRIESIVLNGFDPVEGMETYDVFTNFSSSPFPFGIDLSFQEVIENCPSPSEENTKFVQFSKKEQKMIESARKLVVQYVKNSDIFKDKDELIESVQTVPFYLYKESDLESLNVEWVPAQTQGTGIYCNKQYDFSFSEAMFVHELIHHIRYQTNHTTSPTYSGTMYDETLVEMITDSINPKDHTNTQVEYDLFAYPMTQYLSLFGAEEVLTAFFYGYDEFFASHSEHLSKVEHNAFTDIVGAFGYHPNGANILQGFCNTWHDRLTA